MELIELGTILEMTKGKKPTRQSSECMDDYLPYVDIKAFETGEVCSFTDGHKCVPCENDDILIVCDGSRSGLVGRAIKGYIGSTLAKISAVGLDSNYLFYFLQGKYTLLNTNKKGTGTPHLNPEIIKKSRLIVPSIPEQKRIITHIEELFSELDKAVEILQTTKQQLAMYRQAVLAEAFSSISESINGTIESVCEVIVDCPHSTPTWSLEGKLCLRTTNFRRGFLDLSEPNYVSAEIFESRNVRLVPRGGDVLYSREGAILGIACIIPDSVDVCLGQRMMLFRTSNQMYNKFLMHYLNSPIVTNYVAMSTGGSASPHINVGDIKKYIVPIPSYDKQCAVVSGIEEKVSTCDNIELTVNSALLQSQILRQSILKNAFIGRIGQSV